MDTASEQCSLKESTISDELGVMEKHLIEIEDLLSLPKNDEVMKNPTPSEKLVKIREIIVNYCYKLQRIKENIRKI